MQVSTIGIDIAKNVFQLHGVDAAGKVVLTRQLRRKQVIEVLGKLSPCRGSEPSQAIMSSARPA